MFPVTVVNPVIAAPPADTSSPPVVTLTPVLAVTRPTESTLLTSSYVNVPAIDTLPTAVISVTVILGEPVSPAAVPLILSLAVM